MTCRRASSARLCIAVCVATLLSCGCGELKSLVDRNVVSFACIWSLVTVSVCTIFKVCWLKKTKNKTKEGGLADDVCFSGFVANCVAKCWIFASLGYIQLLRLPAAQSGRSWGSSSSAVGLFPNSDSCWTLDDLVQGLRELGQISSSLAKLTEATM